jgi:hypothetical protein
MEVPIGSTFNARQLVHSTRPEVVVTLHWRGRESSGPAKYALGEQIVALGWNMKAFVVLILILIACAAATAVAYARTDVVVGVAAITARAARPDEPIALLLSGSTLLVVATALRRRVM